MLELLRKLSQSKLIPGRTARRKLEEETERSRKAEAELRAFHGHLEVRIAEHAAELARATEALQAEIARHREVEATVSAIGDAIPFGVWIYEPSGRVRYLSKSLLDLMGVNLNDCKQNSWTDLLPPEAREQANAAWRTCVETASLWDYEFQMEGKDGTVYSILSRGVPVRNSDGTVVTYAGIQLDVTERARMQSELRAAHDELESLVEQRTAELNEANRQLMLDLAERMKAEQALRDSESQLRALFDNSLDAIIVTDDRRRLVDANPSARALLGLSSKALGEFSFEDFVPADRRADVERDWEIFLKEGAQQGECELRRLDGSLCIADFSSKANFLPGRHLSSLRDVTERKKAEASLRKLSQRLLKLQDEERRRIARELHDSAGQSLAAVKMNLDAVKKEAGKLGPAARKALEEGLSLSDKCADDVRTLSYLLHPPLLDEVGLVPALRWYTEGFAQRSRIRVDLDLPAELTPLPQDVATALFRIVQEGLTNIHRHSESPTARIRLASEKNRIILEVSDKGRGISPDALVSSDGGIRTLGVGIAGMHERVRQLGGKLQITPGDPGTVVRASLPLVSNESASAAAGR
jgi:PAS domain S-box-containing protein